MWETNHIDDDKFALDFGGSVLKIVTSHQGDFRPEGIDLSPVQAFQFHGSDLKLFATSSTNTPSFLKYLHELGVKEVYITGGGSHKYQEVLESYNITYLRIAEMQSIFEGLKLLKLLQEPFSHIIDDNLLNFPSSELEYPYLLVNVGSGTSMIAMYNEEEYKRVDGTPVGGGTFFGLVRLLTSVENYEQLEQLSGGISNNIDLTVGDIYGEDDSQYKELGLKSSIKASCFGKIGAGIISDYKNSDVVDSVVFMIGCVLAQIANFVANRENIKTIVFSGGMLNFSPVHGYLQFFVNYYSNQKTKVIFVNSKYSKFTGALGCFKKLLDDSIKK